MEKGENHILSAKRLMRIIVIFFFALLTSGLAMSQFSHPQTDRPITTALRSQLMDSLINNVVDDYVFPDKAKQIGALLKKFRQGKEFAAITSFQQFSNALNQQLRQFSNDKHLALLYSNDTVPVEKEQEVSFPAFIKEFAVNNNYGFTKVEILPGNIGYINILGFFPFAEATDVATGAFRFIENTAALIIDLRHNNGGESNFANFVLGYFFAPEPVNVLSTRYRKNNRVEQSWTPFYIPGKRYLDKPVYILTSNQTFSAGEATAFILQAHHKATIVGEQTGGGANMCELKRLHQHMMLNLPVASPIVGETNNSWEGTGVIPDIITTSDLAFDAAHAAALQKLGSTIKPKIH